MFRVLCGPDVYHYLLGHRSRVTWNEVEFPNSRRAYVEPQEHRILLVDNDGVAKPAGRRNRPRGCRQDITTSLSGYGGRPARIVIKGRPLDPMSVGRRIGRKDELTNSLYNRRDRGSCYARERARRD